MFWSERASREFIEPIENWIENQKNHLIQAISQEKEIVEEVIHVCQQKIERPMMKDEEILQTLIDSDLFRNKTIEDQKSFLLLNAQQ